MKQNELDALMLKNRGNISICGICGIADDGKPVLKSDMEKLVTSKRKSKKRQIQTCNNCKEALRSGVMILCEGRNFETNEPCSSVYGFDEKLFQKYIPSAKKGELFRALGCPKCNVDKKFILS